MQATVDKVEYEHIPDEHGSAERGEPCIGIRAKATVRVFLPSHPDGHALIVPITSGGLWGVEEASEPSYIAEVESEEKAALVELLAAFGLRLDEDREHVPYGSEPITDAEAMDRLVAKLNEPGQWNGGDVCEVAATLCTLTNREIKDDEEDED